MEPTKGWARNHIPDESNIVRHFADDIVQRREGLATKRGNNFLRKWNEGERPLDWALFGPLPIKLPDGLRVRLDAATLMDIEDAAVLMEEEAKRNFDKVVILVRALRDLVREARGKGFQRISQLGNLTPRDENRMIQPLQGSLFEEDTEDDVEDDDDLVRRWSSPAGKDGWSVQPARCRCPLFASADPVPCRSPAYCRGRLR